MKNPFKKSSIMDTVVNVGIGGASNALIDLGWNKVDFLAGLGDTTKNAIKIVGGAVVGSMISNKYARAAADGIATVGVSNLVAGLLPSDEPSTTAGLAEGTIGRIRLGQRGFARRAGKRVAGVAGSNFMGC